MRRILSLLVVVSLMATPALAYGPGPDDKEKTAVPSVALHDAAVLAARAIVLEEIAGRPIDLEPVVPQDSGMAGGKVAAGVALVALGIGLIFKGTDLHTSEEDPFGRTKNADAFLAMGVGSVFSVFGILLIRGGMAGRGFNN